jgi:tungstate transport system substrate-binding protein
MIQSLIMAEEQGGMILTDRGTYIKYRDTRGENPRTLAIVHEGGGALKNPYAIMAVNPEKCPNSRYQEAKALIDWLTSDAAREKIAGFRLLGQPLFFVE